MTHWHITNTTPDYGITSDIMYENGAKSILDYVEVVYNVFNWQLDEEDKSQYLSNKLTLSETEKDYKIYTSCDKMTLYWRDCDDDPCVLAAYN